MKRDNKGGKRTAFQIERDRAEAARLYLRGWLQWRIARHIGQTHYGNPEFLTRQSISRDLAAIRKAWLASQVRDFDAAKAEELAKLDQLELTYWEGWERSIEESRKRVLKETQKGQERSVMTEERTGDPRYLDGVMRCIERRCHLLGLDAPAKLDLGQGGIHVYLPDNGRGDGAS